MQNFYPEKKTFLRLLLVCKVNTTRHASLTLIRFPDIYQNFVTHNDILHVPACKLPDRQMVRCHSRISHMNVVR